MFEIFSAKNAVECFWSYIYAHGELETLMGFDLIGSNVPAPAPGIHHATYNDQPCLLVIWDSRHGRTGLCSLVSDTEGIRAILKAHREKPDKI